MKKFIVIGGLLIAGLLPVSAAAAPAATEAAGHYEVCALETLDSRTAAEGDKVRLQLGQDMPEYQLHRGDVLIGTVVKAKQGSGWGCPGKLLLQAELAKQPLIYGQVSLHGTPPNFFVQFSLLGAFVKGKKAVLKAGKDYPLRIVAVSQP